MTLSARVEWTRFVKSPPKISTDQRDCYPSSFSVHSHPSALRSTDSLLFNCFPLLKLNFLLSLLLLRRINTQFAIRKLQMSTDPLDVSLPLVEGLSHISLVASSADLFYSTVQFYESLGFNAVSLVPLPSPTTQKGLVLTGIV